MSFISRVLSIPLQLIKSPSQFVSGIWQDGGRGQFLVLGMPAVITFVLGMTALGLAYVNKGKLDSRYESLAQRARDNAERVKRDMELDVPVGNIEALDKDDPRPDELANERNRERIYLEKLISLDPEDPVHKFNLAQLAIKEGDLGRGESLMQVIAPFDEPGYAPAHLYLAKFYIQQPHRTAEAKGRALERAKAQVENALNADQENREAKQIKAALLSVDRQYSQAYELYNELFEDDPKYYKQLLQLSALAEKSTDQKLILEQACRAYRRRINEAAAEDNVAELVDSWNHFVICMTMREKYSELISALKNEINDNSDDSSMIRYLKDKLSAVFTESVKSKGRDADLQIQKQQLRDLAQAYENNPRNIDALRWLTILGFDSDIGDDARTIYDPRKDPDPPWVVLLELGMNALDKKEIEDSIVYFERARRKQPRSPQILNNLAYAYLQSENKNPEQALLLVDQAIAYVRNMRNSRSDSREQILSSFYDTRGSALMQLGRMDEAAAALEVAFRNRPDSTSIIENLIKCYESTGDERTVESYRRRLEALTKQQSTAGEGNR